MKNQVITVNRRKYAVGLFWQPTAAGQSARNYAHGLARSIDKKLNLYTEYRAMVGLGARKYGHRNGMPSAAAEVMDALTEYSSFLAVFDLGNTFYLVAVRNGIVLEDKLFSSADAARKEYVQLFEIPDWNVMIAPSSWGMPRAIERKLSDLVSGAVRAILRPISRLRGSLGSVFLIVVFMAIIFAVFRGPLGEMMTHRPQVAQIDEELAAEYKKQIEEKNKELDAEFNIQKPLPPEPIVLPYENFPNRGERAAICFKAIGFLMQPVYGWNQVSAQCGEDEATVLFKRGFGTLGDFYAVATELMPHSFVEEKDEDTIVLRVALPDAEIVASAEERDAETVVRDVNTLFQAMNSDVQIKTVTDTLTNGVDVVNLDVVEIAAASKLTPMQFMEIFNDFGGVYMTRCTWDAAKRTWNYEVIIYAK